MKKTGFLAAALVLIIFNACEHQPNDLVAPGADDTTNVIIPTTNCDPDSVYFQNTILPILVSNCNGTGCHNATDKQGDIVLDNYNNIMKIVKAGKPLDSKLVEVITKTDPNDVMPPPPANPLDATTINLIKKWIAQGAKNNVCNNGCDTAKFTYQADISKIISANCMGCHATGATKLGTYNELKAQVDNGKLWNSINHIGNYPMPSSTLKLPECNIKKIQKWIASGAPNN